MTANAGRPDYDATIRDPLLHPGEPQFRLRAQDELAVATIQYWASLAHEAGVDPAVVEQALQQADAFAKWTHRKLPDADHLTVDQRKQLAFQLSRRAWRAAVPANSVADILAAQRDVDQATAEAREAARLAKAATCKHAAWSFCANGRVCPDCGTVMIEQERGGG